jgi:hypothetical protein
MIALKMLMKDEVEKKRTSLRRMRKMGDRGIRMNDKMTME